jgi:hypothetical protein
MQQQEQLIWQRQLALVVAIELLQQRFPESFLVGDVIGFRP